MKKIFTLLLLLLTCNATWAQEDKEDSKDHPMFNRMSNFYIAEYNNSFDAVEFQVGNNDYKNLEGNKTFIRYAFDETKGKAPSELQIVRNFDKAVKNAGGKIIWQEADRGYSVYNFKKSGTDIWVIVEGFNSGFGYYLTVLEMTEMKQEITANEMLEALNTNGFIALYINFATGKSIIEEASMGTVKQIAEMLKQNEDLKVSIQGHTDNVGTPEANKTLSGQRAESVKKELIKQGIAATRLNSKGMGQESPVADNRTEEGRSKNRRVEIIKL